MSLPGGRTGQVQHRLFSEESSSESLPPAHTFPEDGANAQLGSMSAPPAARLGPVRPGDQWPRAALERDLAQGGRANSGSSVPACAGGTRATVAAAPGCVLSPRERPRLRRTAETEAVGMVAGQCPGAGRLIFACLSARETSAAPAPVCLDKGRRVFAEP